MKTSLPPRKKERGKVLYYLDHLASISVHLRRMSSVSSVVINSGCGLSAHGGEYIFIPRMKTTLPPRKVEPGNVH